MTTFVRESFIVFRRQIRMNLRNPAWVIIGALQPVLYLVLFGPLLKPLVSEFGATNAYTFLVPGLLVQLGMFGAFFAGFGLIAEWREGVVEAERVTPASRTALLVGRLMRDLLQLLVQALILIALGTLMGCAPPGRARSVRGRDGAGHQHGDDAGAAQRDHAADDARPGLAGAAQRLHAVPVDRRRRP